MILKNLLLYILLLSCSHPKVTKEDPKPAVTVSINETKTAQTIHNFAASDAWSCQFVGGWPDEKRNAIADLLFSLDTTSEGSPKGIGLTLWRYNMGAGSANQGDASGIKDEWRRAASATTNTASNLIQAQNWFLSAAKQRGVQQFLAFYNSPPIELTKNNKAFADGGVCNIDSAHYSQFAGQVVKAIKQIEATTSVQFNFLSPVNEPQWDWSDGGQEGCPYTNTEISDLVKSFDKEFVRQSINTKILLPEAGHLKYFLPSSDKPTKDNQVTAFFDPASSLYLGHLPSVYKAAAAHSYFSTSPARDAIELRKKVSDLIRTKDHLQYWQSEYCVLGDNAGEINGSGRDLGMSSALYIAKVIQQDLVWANAAAWQWWLAISPYDYKDGLIYVDQNETDGNFYASKMLWALGNYSRFIRPGMIRVEASSDDPDVLLSVFKEETSGKLVIVAINILAADKPIALQKATGKVETTKGVITYTTNDAKNLAKKQTKVGDLVLPARSVTTIILD